MNIQFSDYDFFKNSRHFKIIEEQSYYCDNNTFEYSKDFMYWGLLNAPTSAKYNTSETNEIQLKRSLHPVMFHNIIGVFTFIGLRLRISNVKNLSFQILSEFNPADFNNDYSSDFAV